MECVILQNEKEKKRGLFFSNAQLNIGLICSKELAKIRNPVLAPLYTQNGSDML